MRLTALFQRRLTNAIFLFQAKLFIWLAWTPIFFLPPLFAQNQQLQFERLSLEDGLSQSTILCILQDSKGYMWFGTGNGLNKYDGYTFTDYRHNPDDPNSISDDWITVLYEDRERNLWIGTESGLNIFDRKTQKFIRFNHNPRDSTSLCNDNIIAIYEDRSGTIWTGTANGLSRLDPANKGTGIFKQYKQNPNNPLGLSSNRISTIYEDQDERLWVGTFDSGLNRFDKERRKITHFIRNSDAHSTYKPAVIRMLATISKKRQPIAAILNVGDSQQIARNFHLDKESTVMILAEGEATDALYDFGWLEKEGAIIWQMEHTETRYAGGAPKNRLQIGLLELQPGEYVLHYQSDDSHSFGKWNQLPPDHPEFWGIQIVPINPSEAKMFHENLDKIYRPRAISSNNIATIYGDSAGGLWIGTFGGGLNKYDSATNTFKYYAKDEPQYIETYSPALFALIDSLNTTPQKLAAIAQVRDLQDLSKPFELSQKSNLLIVTTGEVTNKRWDFGWVERRGRTIWEMQKEQALYAGGSVKNRVQISLTTLNSGGYLLRYRSDNSHSYEYWNDMPPTYPEWWGIQLFIINDSQKKLIKSLLQKTVISTTITNNTVRGICQDNSDALWLATANGLSKFDPKSEQFTNYRHDPTVASSLSTNDIQSIYQDKSGTIWIGTVLGGINKLSFNMNRFTTYTSNPFVENRMTHRCVYSFCEDQNGAIWVGTLRGLNVFEKKHGDLVLNTPEAILNQFGSMIIMSLHEDREGTIWVGTKGGGLFRIYPDKIGSHTDDWITHFTCDPSDSTSIGANQIYSIFEHSNGDLWIGTYGGGLNKLNKKKEEFTRFVHKPGDPNSLSHNLVRTIYEDRTCSLWIGTYGGGLNKFDAKDNSFIHFENVPGDTTSLSHSAVTSLYQDDDGNLWVATYGGGLNKLVFTHEKTPGATSAKFKRYSEKHGLPNNVIYSILPDDFGNLWLSTNKGLSKFNPVTEEFKNYDMHNGLQSNEFNTGAYLKCRHGEMLFGGINGFNIVRPDSVKDNPHVPEIVITDFRKFDKSVRFDKAFSQIDKIGLTYKENYISFEFAALDYTNPAKNQYAYMLEGFDDNWIFCGNRRYASYTNLAPGNYVFRVKGSNNDGLWNEAGTAIRLWIAPPFWQTWWFLMLATASLLVALLAAHRYRVNLKIKQSLRMERMRVLERERVREQISRDYHDEIGHKLTKITLFAELIKRNQKNGNSEIQKYLQKIVGASQSLDNNTRDFIWTLNPEKDKLYDLALYLKEFGASLFDDTEMRFQVNEICKEFETVQLPMQWKRQLTFIFKEAMHNVLRHSASKNVVLVFMTNNGNLEIALTDDGRGFDNHHSFSKNGSGNGLSNMRKRAEKIGGVIRIHSEIAKGTSVRFTGKIPRNGYMK